MTEDKSLVKSEQPLRLFSSRRQPPLLVGFFLLQFVKDVTELVERCKNISTAAFATLFNYFLEKKNTIFSSEII